MLCQHVGTIYILALFYVFRLIPIFRPDQTVFLAYHLGPNLSPVLNTRLISCLCLLRPFTQAARHPVETLALGEGSAK